MKLVSWNVNGIRSALGKGLPEFLTTERPEILALQETKARATFPLNVFIDRDALPIWAEHLGLELVEIRGAAEAVVPAGNLGQAICILQKPR